MKKTGYKNAFTIVEVVLSLGIVAFAVVSLLSLMSLGITAQQETELDQAAARLAANLHEDIQSKKAELIFPDTGGKPAVRYYNSDLKFLGLELEDEDLSEALFSVEIDTEEKDENLLDLTITVTSPVSPDIPLNHKSQYKFYSRMLAL